MDIINHLTRTVSPAVIGDDRSPAKMRLLEQFYAIFAAKLADPEVLGRFSSENIAHNDKDIHVIVPSLLIIYDSSTNE